MPEISGKTVDGLQPGMRQHGHIQASVSGIARHIAENLARLDIDTVPLVELRLLYHVIGG